MLTTTVQAKKNALITGATSGIGKAVSEKLLLSSASDTKTPWNKVIGASRSSPNYPLDLSNPTSVENFVHKLKQESIKLDLVILNAGMMTTEFKVNKLGYEMGFATNHLGHFQLVNLLYKESLLNKGCRILVLASHLHTDLKKWHFDFENFTTKGEKFNPSKAYSTSKLANVYFAYHFNEYLGGNDVTCNAVCPGFIPSTGLKREQNVVAKLFLDYFMPLMPFTSTLDKSAKFIVDLGCGEEYNGVSGKYFRVGDGGKESTSSELSYDKKVGRQLWELSNQVFGF